MKWAGRVLLIVLIASTLFVAKQNDFQTETAFAQTGSTRNLTLNLNDIEVRVVKRDNPSSTTAGSAVIDSQTTAVYFNKVKVINNSNQDIFFRITAQLYYGTTPGPCAIAGGISCAPPNQYRIVTPGQTLTLPDNTFLLPSNMFNFLSGQYPFQTLALQGINKADLNFILSEAGYASTNVTKAQILKWSAVRVKLQDGAGIPVSGKLVGLFKEGESNTQPPPDQWRSGNSNAAGQAAMALLDPITILPAPPLTYTARYVSGTNPQDYTDLPPPVVVTGADFQDLTFTICDGGTGGQGFLVERAQAQEACLPNLIIDTTEAKTVIIDDNEREVATLTVPSRVGKEDRYANIRGIKVKNIGQARASGNITYKYSFYLPGTVFDGVSLPGTISISLMPGESQTLPDFPDLGVDDTIGAISNLFEKSSVGLRVKIDTDNAIVEQNEQDNDAAIDVLWKWPLLKIKVLAGQSPIPYNEVIAFRQGDDKSIDSMTRRDGTAYFVLYHLRDLSPQAYNIIAIVGDGEVGRVNNIQITEEKLYAASINIIGDLIIITSTVLFEADVGTGEGSNFQPIPLPLPSGEAKIKRVKATRASDELTAPIKNGKAVFSSETKGLTKGKYDLTKVDGHLAYASLRDNAEVRIDLNWPELSRGQALSDVPSLEYGSGPVLGSVTLKNLKKLTTQNDTTIEIYGPSDRIENYENIHLNPIRQVLSRINSWPRFNSLGLTFFRVGPAPIAQNVGALAYYDHLRHVIGIDAESLRKDEVVYAVAHEVFHYLDHAHSGAVPSGWTSANPAYLQSITDQLSTELGQDVWDAVSQNCAYVQNGLECTSYTARKVNNHRSTDRFHSEALAEELATLCLYKIQIVDKLDNLVRTWPTQPPPPELSGHVTATKNRIQGKNTQGVVMIPQINTWYDYCLNN